MHEPEEDKRGNPVIKDMVVSPSVLPKCEVRRSTKLRASTLVLSEIRVRRLFFRQVRALSEFAVPIGVLPDIEVVRNVLQNSAAHVQNVHFSLRSVEHFAFGSNQNRIRSTTLPPRAENFYRIRRIVAVKEIILIERVLFLKKCRNQLLLVRIVDAQSHNIQRPVGIHSDHGLQFREFFDTWSAPGGPNVDQQKLVCTGILAQCLELIGGDQIQSYRPLVELGNLIFYTGRLVGPLCRAPNRWRVCDGDRLSGQQSIDGISCFVFRRQLLTLIAIDTSLVSQNALLVKDERVRSRSRPVFKCNRLSGAIV